MEKKNPNDKRSSSAPCVNERAGRVHASAERSECTGRVHASKVSSTVRNCFAVITFLLLSVSMVSPAFAYAIDNADNQTAATILSGNVTYTVSPSSDDASDTVSVTHPIGGILPMVYSSGEYYGQDFEDYLLSVTNDPEWSLLTEYRLSRTLKSISNMSFASFGYNIRTLEDNLDGKNRIPYESIQYSFDPYMFYDNFDASVFKWLVRLKLNRPCIVTTKVVYTVALEGIVGFFSVVSEDSYTSNGSPSSIDAYHPFDKASQMIQNQVGTNGSVLIREMYVTVTPLSPQQIISTGIELLGSNWIVGIPEYVPVDDNLNYDPIRFSYDRFMQYLGDIYDGIETPDIPNVAPPTADNFATWTSWLGEVVAGFFGVEIFPGFSFGSIFAVMAVFIIMWLLLKLFAGG